MDLVAVLEKRVNYLFKNKYQKSAVGMREIFPEKVRSSTFTDYVIERTQMRPRDLIAFVNQILDNAAGQVSVSAKNVTNSEAEYSRKRYDALLHEWLSVHPCLNLYLDVLKSKTGRVALKEFSVREMAVNVCLLLDEKMGSGAIDDEVSRACDLYSKRENAARLTNVGRAMLAVLYKVGAIELKIAKYEHHLSSYKDTAIIDPDQIADEATFTVSPMLWRKLGISPNI